MSAWIGPLGSLIEFKCPSAVESTSEDPHVYFRPLGGDVTATRLGDGIRPRVWEVSVSTARPQQVAALQALGDGAFGPGPFVFIPPGAPSLNMLGKRQALSLGETSSAYVVTQGGTPVSTPEGLAGAYYGTTSDAPASYEFGTAPVIPGVPVTGKAFTQSLLGGTSTVQLVFFTAGGGRLTETAIISGSSTSGEYLTVTGTPPAGAAYVHLRARGAVVTHPQVTWTEEPRTWTPSAASINVVVSPLSDSVRRATGRPGEETITDHRFSVTELRA